MVCSELRESRACRSVSMMPARYDPIPSAYAATLLAASLVALACQACVDLHCAVVPAKHDVHPASQPTSLLGRPLHERSEGDDLTKLDAYLAGALARLEDVPSDPERIVWVGRRLGYLWRMRQAIDVYTRGIQSHPQYAPLYRHRGHRYISLREFDKAIADLERAAELIAGKPDRVEPDGMPNARNVPLTTTGFNVWYHLALAHYLKGNYERALRAFRKTTEYTRGVDDNLVAVTDWMYMSLRRLGRDDEASALLERIKPDMEIIENRAYHRRLLSYKGLIDPATLLDVEQASELDVATLAYGLGNWYFCNGREAKAVDLFERIVAGPYWPAFGFIAAEADLARIRGQWNQD